MRYKYYLFVIFIFSFLTAQVYAALLYRHVPFTVVLNQGDKLVVDYDFSKEKGIHCMANQEGVLISFTYKGYQKTSALPVILQSDHIPDKADEELADVQGQFTILIKSAEISRHADEINCSYL